MTLGKHIALIPVALGVASPSFLSARSLLISPLCHLRQQLFIVMKIVYRQLLGESRPTMPSYLLIIAVGVPQGSVRAPIIFYLREICSERVNV